jgi:hypothetical protein
MALSGSGLVEGEIRQGLERGGGITGVVVVCRVIDGQLEHVAYIRTSWRKEYLPLRTWGDRSDRTYRDTDRLLELLRTQFGYEGVIHFYTQGDPTLPSIAHVAEKDLLPFEPAKPKE